jgi:hypothetical protein
MKTFELRKGHNYLYLGIARIDDKKVYLRYFEINDDFTLTEIDTFCNETDKIEKMCRKWAEKNNYVMWSY